MVRLRNERVPGDPVPPMGQVVPVGDKGQVCLAFSFGCVRRGVGAGILFSVIDAGALDSTGIPTPSSNLGNALALGAAGGP